MLLVSHLLFVAGLFAAADATTKVGIDDDYFYVDNSFSCPLQTDPTVDVCSQVCVETTAECPAELQCDTGSLCEDGSCQATCPVGLENPCSEYLNLTAACYMGGFTATESSCSDTFVEQYDAMAAASDDDLTDDYYGDLVGPCHPSSVLPLSSLLTACCLFFSMLTLIRFPATTLALCSSTAGWGASLRWPSCSSPTTTRSRPSALSKTSFLKVEGNGLSSMLAI